MGTVQWFSDTVFRRRNSELVNREVLRTQKQLRLARREIDNVSEKVGAINKQVTEVEESLDSGFARLTEVINDLGARPASQGGSRHRPMPVNKGSPRKPIPDAIKANQPNQY